MRIARAGLAAAGAAAIGIALAALPHTENDPCLGYGQEVVGNPHYAFSWFPLGHRCSPADFVGASTGATIAWMVAAALFLGVLLRRDGAAARGAFVGLATLALMGVVYMRVGPIAPAAMLAVSAGSVVGYVVARVPGALLPPVAIAVWAFPYLLGYGEVATVAGVAAAAGAAWAAERLRGGSAARSPAPPAPASPAGP